MCHVLEEETVLLHDTNPIKLARFLEQLVMMIEHLCHTQSERSHKEVVVGVSQPQPTLEEPVTPTSIHQALSVESAASTSVWDSPGAAKTPESSQRVAMKTVKHYIHLNLVRDQSDTNDAKEEQGEVVPEKNNEILADQNSCYGE
ncbi:hypothetical protein L484_019337 [Morus notabilis]|uniref:Uncharacterized protein n=1 Tax=Morus notabilis TaxID=981085 RepID=W9QP33_9ROSA|nr:hypothetical protein L484_019337 [Morus notabilis]